MIKTDPIIAVNNVKKSTEWYQVLLECKSIHNGEKFGILMADNNEVIICLHQWGEHEHPTMKDKNIIAGNGLILYFRTDKLDAIRKNTEKISCTIEKDIHKNPNTSQREFSLRDLDGYYLTITEYHNYEG